MGEKVKQIDKRFLIIVGAIFGILILVIVAAVVMKAISGKNLSYEKIEEKLAKQLKEYFKLTQEFNSDIAGIGKYVKTKYLTWEEFEKSDWLKNYKNAKINVNVNVDLNVSRVISHTVPNV